MILSPEELFLDSGFLVAAAQVGEDTRDHRYSNESGQEACAEGAGGNQGAHLVNQECHDIAGGQLQAHTAPEPLAVVDLGVHGAQRSKAGRGEQVEHQISQGSHLGDGHDAGNFSTGTFQHGQLLGVDEIFQPHEADRQGATDIHIEPQETELRIRYRIDGMLHKVDVPPQLNRLKAAIISRIKVMANLDIAEKRLPMDGRIGIKISGQDIDIRVSTMPAAYGESISLRLLAKSGSFVKMADLGFNERDFAVVDKIIHRPNGIFLVTGPTGSGKSTSLYSFLHEVNKIDVRIMTAEDPIEYHMAGINQVQMQADIGMTFARALRAFLRQDPDIIMVGEIRDRETAEIAINASLTGHMVFSTLHTNDAAGAFPRLIDMGVEPFLIASAVAGVMGQRLCRRLCPNCMKEVPLDMKYYTLNYAPEKNTVFEPNGCDACSRTGYKGRRALFEVLEVDEDIEGAIVRRENATEIRNRSLAKGMKTLREDGWAKAFRGVTSVKEIMRVTEEQ